MNLWWIILVIFECLSPNFINYKKYDYSWHFMQGHLKNKRLSPPLRFALYFRLRLLVFCLLFQQLYFDFWPKKWGGDFLPWPPLSSSSLPAGLHGNRPQLLPPSPDMIWFTAAVHHWRLHRCTALTDAPDTEGRTRERCNRPLAAAPFDA